MTTSAHAAVPTKHRGKARKNLRHHQLDADADAPPVKVLAPVPTRATPAVIAPPPTPAAASVGVPPTPAPAPAPPADVTPAEDKPDDLPLIPAAPVNPFGTANHGMSSPAAPPEIAAIPIGPSDGSVAGATQVLADAVRTAYSKLGRNEAFHRIAVPTFTEVGPAVAEHHLGQLVAEMMASQLSRQAPFTVVERDHLDQVMKEYRLADLGVVDPSNAAQFGKILGAQSILSGSVAEAGPMYVITGRLVDVQTGQVLVSGQTQMPQAGLIALSSDAVVMRSRTGALFRSVLIPGWGQYYNQQPIQGTIFLGAAVASLGTAAGFYLSAQSAFSLYNQRTAATVPERAIGNNRIQIANAALITYGVVWAINLIDAYLGGSDSTTVQLPVTGD